MERRALYPHLGIARSSEKDLKVTVQLPRRRPYRDGNARRQDGQDGSAAGRRWTRVLRSRSAFWVGAEARQAEYLTENAALGQAGMARDLNRLSDEQNAAEARPDRRRRKVATQQVFDDVDVERGKTRVTEILSAPAPKPERNPRSDKGTHKRKPAPDLGGTLRAEIRR